MFDFLRPKPVRVQYIGVHNLKKKARKFKVELEVVRKKYGEEETKMKSVFDKGYKIL